VLSSIIIVLGAIDANNFFAFLAFIAGVTAWFAKEM